MMEKRVLGLVIDYLEYSYDELQEYLERVKEIDGAEAELIIAELRKIMEQRNGTTKSN